jgi:hypothetical protein
MRAEELKIEIGRRYGHYRTKDPYTVISFTPIKIDGEWTDGIVYQGQDGKTWCRTLENFKEKFSSMIEELTDEEIVEKLIERDDLKHTEARGKRRGSTKSDKAMRRYYLFRKAYKKEGVSQTAVAKMFNLVEHSSVIHGLKQFNILVEQNYKPFMEIKAEYDNIFRLRRMYDLDIEENTL